MRYVSLLLSITHKLTPFLRHSDIVNVLYGADSELFLNTTIIRSPIIRNSTIDIIIRKGVMRDLASRLGRSLVEDVSLDLSLSLMSANGDIVDKEM